MTHTAESLLAAVGVDWKVKYGCIFCPECGGAESKVVGQQHIYSCFRPSTRDVEPTYTGPALGTPELDAVLLVEGVRWCRDKPVADRVNVLWSNSDLVAFHAAKSKSALLTDTWLFEYPQPGHALAAAIAEVKS